MTTPSAHLIARRVFWTPKTNTQRSALARFGTDWQLAKSWPAMTVKGRLCRLIHPVGNSEEARWVPVEQVKFKDEV